MTTEIQLSTGMPSRDRAGRPCRHRDIWWALIHLPSAEQEDRAAKDRHRAERHDDRRHVELPDQQAVDRAEQAAPSDHDAEQQHAGTGRPGKAALSMRRDHAAQRQVGRHREVDAVRQDHAHLAERQDDQDRGVVIDAAEAGRRDEARHAAARSAATSTTIAAEQLQLAVFQERAHACSSDAGGGADELFGRQPRRARIAPAIRPSRMTMTRSDMPMISGISEDTMMTARPARGQFAHEVVHGGLGADVDALGRLVQDDDLRLGRQPLGDHHLLLVAARQRADILVERGGAQIEPRRSRAPA